MKIILILITSLFFAADCSKKDEDITTINGEDSYFVMQAAYFNLAKVNEGKIAFIHSNTDSIKSFGQRIITTYSTAGFTLDTLASSLNITGLPITPDIAHISEAIYLDSLSGITFDSAYISSQITDHAGIIFIYQRELAGGNNEQIKSYAKLYLPVLQQNYAQAQGIQAMLK